MSTYLTWRGTMTEYERGVMDGAREERKRYAELVQLAHTMNNSWRDGDCPMSPCPISPYALPAGGAPVADALREALSNLEGESRWLR